MAGKTDSLDLSTLQLSAGQARQVDLLAEVERLQFGGQTYSSDDTLVPVVLDVTRTKGGYSLRLRYDAQLGGPCMRCLEDAHAEMTIDAREIDQPRDEDEDLRSPYIDGAELDLRSWVRDSLALELPAQIVCREDCAGLCATCGVNMNEAGPDHFHEREPDPRWAKLGELRLEEQ
ncbi:MAG: hypothetical protein QOD53_1052 [Thermoleophilaceae bacterium]|jgi:uncharacterized protein|nr:hypothetical protein [Thermoleophilaceae bacterium]